MIKYCVCTRHVFAGVCYKFYIESRKEYDLIITWETWSGCSYYKFDIIVNQENVVLQTLSNTWNPIIPRMIHPPQLILPNIKLKTLNWKNLISSSLLALARNKKKMLCNHQCFIHFWAGGGAPPVVGLQGDVHKHQSTVQEFLAWFDYGKYLR